MDCRTSRREERARLIALRASLPGRDGLEARMRRHVLAWLEGTRTRSAAFWWPFRAEPDMRGAIGQWLAAAPGRTAALPVIEGGAMRFARWSPDCAMQPGRFGIPVPSVREWIEPEALLVPCVGFTRSRIRLGYGGGWYDRTLAAMARAPATAGVAFGACLTERISPEPHDVALGAIITESGLLGVDWL